MLHAHDCRACGGVQWVGSCAAARSFGYCAAALCSRSSCAAPCTPHHAVLVSSQTQPDLFYFGSPPFPRRPAPALPATQAVGVSWLGPARRPACAVPGGFWCHVPAPHLLERTVRVPCCALLCCPSHSVLMSCTCACPALFVVACLVAVVGCACLTVLGKGGVLLCGCAARCCTPREGTPTLSCLSYG